MAKVKCRADEFAAPFHWVCTRCHVPRPAGSHPCRECLNPEFSLAHGECPGPSPSPRAAAPLPLFDEEA
jgi:hypothetical protein